MIFENDCEDQGFSRISDGCLKFECQTWQGIGNRARPVHPKFIKQRSPSNASLPGGGPLYWVCSKCGGYYGEVRGR